MPAGFFYISRHSEGTSDNFLYRRHEEGFPPWCSLEIQVSCTLAGDEYNKYQFVDFDLSLNYIASDFGGDLDMRFMHIHDADPKERSFLYRTEHFPCDFEVEATVEFILEDAAGNRHTFERTATLGPAHFPRGVSAASGIITEVDLSK